jgi:NAD(P)-dependent dehydrogenase (short-subunit alcohol dehydrogenase family)
MDYAPAQRLQPHVHDGDEQFEIKGGAVRCYQWEDEAALLRGDAPTDRWLKAGDTMKVSRGTPHCIYGHQDTGFQFHEVVGDFNKRSTKFYADADFTLGEDGELRYVPPQVRKRFQGRTVLITGCSRGLGLGLTRHFLMADADVIATCRTPAKAARLAALYADLGAGRADRGSRVLACDVSSEESMTALAQALQGTKIDVLFHNAGIASQNHPVDPVLNASRMDLLNVFQTNVAGTVMLTNLIVPLMKASARPLIIGMSSQLASIHNCLRSVQPGAVGGKACYRMSKAALNMAMRCFAAELKDPFCALSLSPGWVDTDMGSTGGRNPPLTVEQSVGSMLGFLATASAKHNGGFYEYNGDELPF